MKRLQRYLLSEAGKSTLILLGLLLTLAISALLADALAQVARGRISPQQLFAVMGLNTLEALRELLPLSLFLGVVLALTRLAQEHELMVMQGSGMSPWQMLGALQWLAWPLFLSLLLVGLWLAPWADRVSDRLVLEASRKMGLAMVQPGRFRTLPGGVLYIGAEGEDERSFRDAWIYMQKEGVDTLITARHGREQEVAGLKVVLLQDGWHLEGVAEGQRWRQMHFRNNRLIFPQEKTDAKPTELNNLPLRALWARNDLAAKAELRARFGPAWSIWALLLLAMPLSRLGPRQGRHGRIALALLVYVLYVNMANLARHWYARGETPALLGMEWVHLLLIMIAAGWWYHQQSVRIPFRFRFHAS